KKSTARDRCYISAKAARRRCRPGCNSVVALASDFLFRNWAGPALDDHPAHGPLHAPAGRRRGRRPGQAARPAQRPQAGAKPAAERRGGLRGFLLVTQTATVSCRLVSRSVGEELAADSPQVLDILCFVVWYRLLPGQASNLGLA